MQKLLLTCISYCLIYFLPVIHQPEPGETGQPAKRPRRNRPTNGAVPRTMADGSAVRRMMTPQEAEETNLSLPEGFKYVPAERSGK